MKKLLILLSLTTAITAFADTPTTLPASKAPQGNTEKSATMNINAMVIQPLKVSAEEMEFERVIQGTTATATGKYTIKGEPGQGIKVSIVTPDSLIGTKGTQRLPINLEYTLPNAVDHSGDASFNINGSISPSNEHLGSYTGEIKVSVQYQ